MSKAPKLPGSILPDGVPADNRSMASGSAGGFTAPDMATPKFPSDDLASKASLRRVERREIEIIEEEDDDDEDERDFDSPPPAISNMAIILVASALLAALVAIVIANGSEPAPLCSTQPDWNQYNCRAG